MILSAKETEHYFPVFFFRALGSAILTFLILNYSVLIDIKPDGRNITLHQFRKILRRHINLAGIVQYVLGKMSSVEIILVGNAASVPAHRARCNPVTAEASSRINHELPAAAPEAIMN